MDWNYEELACCLCGLDYDQVCDEGDEWETITDALEKKFGVDFDTFVVIADALIDYTPVVNTALTDTPVHGFVVKEGDKLYRFIVKKKAQSPALAGRLPKYWVPQPSIKDIWKVMAIR